MTIGFNVEHFSFFIEISITQFVINEHKSSSQQSTEIPEYNQKFIDDMKSLLESYRIQGREKLFLADMELLAGAYKTAGYTDLFLQSVEALIRSLVSRWHMLCGWKLTCSCFVLPVFFPRAFSFVRVVPTRPINAFESGSLFAPLDYYNCLISWGIIPLEYKSKVMLSSVVRNWLK